METILNDQIIKWTRSPCVYVVWQGEECLYVGASTRGIVRPITNPIISNYNTISKLELHWCVSRAEAFKLERELTKQLQPSRLSKGKRGRKKQENTEVVYFRLPISIAKRLRDEAVSNNREISSQVRLILEQQLNAEKK